MFPPYKIMDDAFKKLGLCMPRTSKKAKLREENSALEWRIIQLLRGFQNGT